MIKGVECTKRIFPCITVDDVLYGSFTHVFDSDSPTSHLLV